MPKSTADQFVRLQIPAHSDPEQRERRSVEGLARECESTASYFEVPLGHIQLFIHPDVVPVVAARGASEETLRRILGAHSVDVGPLVSSDVQEARG